MNSFLDLCLMGKLSDFFTKEGLGGKEWNNVFQQEVLGCIEWNNVFHRKIFRWPEVKKSLLQKNLQTINHIKLFIYWTCIYGTKSKWSSDRERYFFTKEVLDCIEWNTVLKRGGETECFIQCLLERF